VNESLLVELTVFVLAAFVGIEVISKVPTMLHTPLMSGTNAIHGVVIVGAILVAGSHHGALTTVVGTIAVAFGASNVIGGFLVTDRMLAMFKPKKAPEVEGAGVSRRGEREQTVPGGRPFGTEREGERR
jgi:NAD(P) transhydrogenase subunit alpha